MTRPAYRWPARRAIAAICAVWWVAAAIATHVPIKSLPASAPGPSILHVIGYAVTTSLFLITLIAHGIPAPRRWIVAVLVIAAYAAVDESTQPWVGRDGSVDDWYADLIGMAFALAMIEVPAALVRFRQRTVRPSR